MPLPKINTPTYELTLPSNRKKIRYRPFLVREEKILVLALESNDQKQITDAIIEIISDCLITKNIDVTKLPTFDIEYLFLNVRSKSVGETVEVNVTCPDDGETSVETSINIDDIKVKKSKDHNLIIKLDEFIDQLNTKQFQQVEQFFKTMPKLSHKIKVKNPKTGVESEVVLEGLASFFS